MPIYQGLFQEQGVSISHYSLGRTWLRRTVLIGRMAIGGDHLLDDVRYMIRLRRISTRKPERGILVQPHIIVPQPYCSSGYDYTYLISATVFSCSNFALCRNIWALNSVPPFSSEYVMGRKEAAA